VINSRPDHLAQDFFDIGEIPLFMEEKTRKQTVSQLDRAPLPVGNSEDDMDILEEVL